MKGGCASFSSLTADREQDSAEQPELPEGKPSGGRFSPPAPPRWGSVGAVAPDRAGAVERQPGSSLKKELTERQENRKPPACSASCLSAPGAWKCILQQLHSPMYK